MEGRAGIGNGTSGAGRRRALVLALLLAMAVTTATARAAEPKLNPLSIHGPTNVPITPNVANQWTIVVEAGSEEEPANAGRFRLAVSLIGQARKTVPLRFTASAKEVQAALEELSSIGPGNVTVTGGPGAGPPSEVLWSYVITIGGAREGVEFEEVAVEELPPSASEREAVKAKGEEIEEPSYEEIETRRGQRDTVQFDLIATNTSSEKTVGPVTVTDTLPPGFTTIDTPQGRGWTCKPGGEGQTTIKCTTETSINPDAEAPAIELEAAVDPSTVHQGETLNNKLKVQWNENKRLASIEDPIHFDNTPASFGVNSFSASSFNASGALDKVAGDRPYAATTSFFFNTANHYNPGTEEVEVLSPGNVKDADVVLPEGFIGNPAGGRHRCTQSEFMNGNIGNPGFNAFAGCPPETQVGVVSLFVNKFSAPLQLPVYNLQPPRGVPAEFGFIIFSQVPVRIDAHVIRLDGKYRVTALSADVNEAYNIYGVELTLWGVPADKSHDAERNQANHSLKNASSPESPVRPFLTNPADCLQQAEVAPVTTLFYDSWEAPGKANVNDEPELRGGNWLIKEAFSPAVEECDKLTFDPQASFHPRAVKDGGSSEAGAPSAYEFNLTIPQNEEPTGKGAPQLKDTVVTLPAGVSLSPSAGNGLEACAPEQIELESTERGHCPAASQVGEVKISSNLLEEELNGRVYVGKPECAPCRPADAAGGKLIHLYIEAEAKGAGVRVKLPGDAKIDQETGQIVSTFANNPQVPFTHLTLTLKGGPRASLANPVQCGTYTSSGVFTPWSLPGEGLKVPGTPNGEFSSPFTIDWDGAGGACPESGLPFNPSFLAGTLNAAAGRYSEFDTVFSRPDDREQAFSASKGIVVRTPVGLLGKIAGVTKCEAAEVEAMIREEGSCPANSRIATAISAAGPGPEPFQASGPVYLTGPYHSPITGAEGPFGLAIAVPAKTKAFDLGTVVVRAAISIDPQTSAITITSDPPPLSKDGIPLRVQQIGVKVDRPEFMFNPTSCEAKQIEATLTGQPVAAEAAGVVEARVPYQATNCAALPFSPRFTAAAGGRATKLDGTSFTVKVEERPGEANIHEVEVQLPYNLPSRLETLQEACDAATFEANPARCPEHSVVGTATAHTPLLSAPLSGPAYLVSHSNLAFPDLVFLLQGEGVHIELVGHTDIKDGITYSRFETVPDAPINSFETDLPKGRYSILGANGNLCELNMVAPTTIISQNNKRFEQRTPISVTECGPTVKITKVKVTAGALLVTVKTSGGGTIRISGAGLKATSVSGLQRGSRTIRVRLNRAGLALARHKKIVKVTATVTAGGQRATSTAKVKA